MTSKQKKMLYRIITAFVLFVVLMVLEHTGVLEQLPSQWLVFLIYLIPYLVIGYDIVYKAVRNISHGQVFDENFLMMVSNFWRVWRERIFRGSCRYAVLSGWRAVPELCSRQIQTVHFRYDEYCPEYANIEEDGVLTQVDPDDVEVGTNIVVKPGERIPLDGIVTEGTSMIDTAALSR